VVGTNYRTYWVKASVWANRLFSLADEQYTAAGKAIEAYRARIDAAWPGAGQYLLVNDSGQLELTLDRRGDVRDLSPLKGMPLTKLSISTTRVSDLTPLAGMPLTHFAANKCLVSDLSPLAGMKLKSLGIMHLPDLHDLSPLKGMPIEDIWMERNGVTDLSPLKGMPIKNIDATSTAIKDLSPLADAPLDHVHVYGTRVNDLSPLRGKRITSMSIAFTDVLDLSPLAGMPLQRLQMDSTVVTDLAPLEGMPLTDLLMQNTRITDVTLLSRLPLERLIFSPSYVVSGIESLRGKKSLKWIAVSSALSEQTAAEFWKKYDAGEYKGSTEETVRGLMRNLRRSTRDLPAPTIRPAK